METRKYLQEQIEGNKDMVNHPSHYKNNGIECIDIMETLYGPEWVYHFCVLNAFKYQFRFKNKGKAQEDLKKAASGAGSHA